MIARLLISPDLQSRVEEINNALVLHLPAGRHGIGSVTVNHPDILYFRSGEKLGIEQARKIKEHFSLKPYSAKGRAVVLEDASALTIEAQNALLKTLEEPPAEAILILAAPSDARLLPTILSRCQVVILDSASVTLSEAKGIYSIEQLLNSSIQERFEYIEKLKDRKEFLHALVQYFHQHLRSHLSGVNVEFLEELLQAEEWAAQNVNIRAILEYLMLIMPKNG